MFARPLLLVSLSLATALALAGCGGSGTPAVTSATQSVAVDPLAGQSIADQSRRLDLTLISAADLAKAGRGTPQRALLSYWSAVQYGDMSAATAAFDPGLVRIIGFKVLTSALRNASASYRVAKPAIRRSVVSGNRADLRYLAASQRTGGKITPLTATFRRLNGRWVIIFNSPLDDELRIDTQTRVQNRIAPGAAKLSPRAAAAGDSAALLQAGFLQQVLGRRG